MPPALNNRNTMPPTAYGTSPSSPGRNNNSRTPASAQQASARACTTLSTITEAAACTAPVPHIVSSLALTTSPPMVATGSRLLTARPIHNAARPWPKLGAWPGLNNRRQPCVAGSITGNQARGSSSRYQPESSSSRSTSMKPCQTSRPINRDRPRTRPIWVRRRMETGSR